jgi:hypothetical protein
LRKNIKIKTLAVLVAWLVILAHSIIPHNHLQEEYREFLSSVRYFIHDSGREENLQILNSPVNDHEDTCHFSDNLFHQLNSDDQLAITEDKSYLINSGEICISLFYEKDQIVPGYILYPNSLRAPPLLG